MNPKVSVIIPVYNVEPYLRQCLDSIVSQTLRDIEIICVDDGSTDSSLDILNEYTSADPRVSVIQQKNQYAGVARNNGMKQASGKYLVFWDSDDYYMPAALEKMYSKCETDNADICVCGGNRYYDVIDVEIETSSYMDPKRIPKTVPFNRETNERYILNFTSETPWNKMFRASFVESLGLEFQSRRNGNDVFFVAVALCLAKRVTVVEDHLVCYRKNVANSLMSTISGNIHDPLMAWADVRKYLLERDALPEQSFENKVLSVSSYHLRSSSTAKAYDEWYKYMKEEGVSSLGLKLHEPDYYNIEWHREFFVAFLELSKEDFICHLMHFNYEQMTLQRARRLHLRAQLKEKKAELKKLKGTKNPAKKIMNRLSSRK